MLTTDHWKFGTPQLAQFSYREYLSLELPCLFFKIVGAKAPIAPVLNMPLRYNRGCLRPISDMDIQFLTIWGSPGHYWKKMGQFSYAKKCLNFFWKYCSVLTKKLHRLRVKKKLKKIGKYFSSTQNRLNRGNWMWDLNPTFKSRGLVYFEFWV